MNKKAFDFSCTTEINKLNELMRLSKAYWGYPQSFMDDFMEIFQLTDKHLSSHLLKTLQQGDEIIGFLGFQKNNDEPLELDYFFIHPSYIGKGFGRKLWEQALVIAKSMGKTNFILWSDPGAEKFYEKMGCTNIGMRKSPLLANRECPIMQFFIDDSQS